MLAAIVTWSLHHRWTVIALAIASVVVGAIVVRHLDVDAFPDTTPAQVQVNTVAAALSPEEIERQITAPVEQAIAGLPRIERVYSISKSGLSQVTVVFADGTDIYFARQLLTERLTTVELPEGISRPEMGPVATGLGEVFHYRVRSLSHDLTAARTIQDWVIKPALRAVPGVAEVNSWGGYEKQYEIQIDPQRVVAHGLTLGEVLEKIRAGNLNVGGGIVERAGTVSLVHGVGRVTSIAEVGSIVVAAKDGVPITVNDVGTVGIGHEIRHGAVTSDGQGEAVLGLGFMLMGENSHAVTSRLKAKLDEIRPFLPADIEATVLYDRTELVDHVIQTVRSNLFEGGLMVVAILFIFLGNLRAGLIVALAIPLSMLVAFDGMLRFGITASLLSLGSLDFGLVVDPAVIMVENAVRRLGDPRERHRDRLAVVRDAALQVLRPALFGGCIIIMVYLPILTLEGVEGKMFRPMALTVIFALVGSLVLAVTLTPVLVSLGIGHRHDEREPWVVRLAQRCYAPVLRLALRHRLTVVVLAGTSVLAAVILMRGLGAEFVPRLSEGAIVINIAHLPGTSLETTARLNTMTERALLAEFPDEIGHIWTRTGTAEVATDPMGIEASDMFVSLSPRGRWTKAVTQADLADRIQRFIRDLPGQHIAMTQPIEMRLNEMVSGVRGDVAIKLFGDDLDVLQAKAGEITAVLYSVGGADGITMEQVAGQPALEVSTDASALARYGIPAADVMQVVSAIGGIHLGDVTEGQLRFPLVARLPTAVRDDPARLGGVPLASASGSRIPLAAVAQVRSLEGPLTINREWGQRRIVIQCNVPHRDVAGFVAEAKAAIAQKVALPAGRYRLEWGGQFENLEQARLRLAMVVPVVLVAIFLLLAWSLASLRLAALVFTGVPVAAIGGIAALWIRGMPFSISAAVGFIALAGVAVLNGLVMVTFIRQLRAQGVARDAAIVQGSLIRLRPVLMTALVAAFGFVPMALATGMGAEVQRPLATVVIGGITSSTLLTLLLIPVLYAWFEPRLPAAITPGPSDLASAASAPTVASHPTADVTSA